MREKRVRFCTCFRAHHGVGFPRRALPVSQQARIIPGEHGVQDGPAERLVNGSLCGMILRCGIRRVEAIVETISSRPLATIPGLARRHLQVCQEYLARLRVDHHLASSRVQFPAWLKRNVRHIDMLAILDVSIKFFIIQRSLYSCLKDMYIKIYNRCLTKEKRKARNFVEIPEEEKDRWTREHRDKYR